MEKAVAPHSSTLAWKIPWMEEPVRLQSMGSLRVGQDWATSLSLFHLHALEKEMATHSSVLAWRISGAGEPGGLMSMESHRVGHNWSDLTAAAAKVQIISEGEKNHSMVIQIFNSLKAQTIFIPSRSVIFANNKEGYKARPETGYRKMVAGMSNAISYGYPGKS